MPTVTWHPGQYQRYGAERFRPFRELLARVGAQAPERVVDLGSGSGELTRTLLERWPSASVVGVDSSPEMVAEAARLAVPGRLEFRRQDLREWRAERPVDVLVSNATLQWVPGHADLLAGFVEALAPGGWLAFQVPGNYGEPSHVLLAELQAAPSWRERLAGVASRPSGPVLEPEEYLDRLVGLGCRTDAWETTYLHVLPGEDAVLEWVKGTALRPVLSVLDPDEAGAFLAEYGAALRRAYPPRAHGTVLPFRRIFAVAQRPGLPHDGVDHVKQG